ncbi:methyltransferase, putative [Plasmodium gallinaceum]|uniref:Methyltransferase, putative n=1 Tax=Plasmodium gallinaceum TaxID=5849 RepID=A0A1J1GXW0_PLAGA|nr:methyltransferase, putative [Plasmodium gallinaceum]CRG97293.1 methyltransferase, putative [Plasmodium gallinaceum]
MKFIKLSIDSYPIKYYSRSHKVTNILKLNGIGLKNSGEEEIKNYFKNFNLTCMTYLIDNEDILYLEFYKKKDCLFLHNFFNNNINGNTINKYNITAEYANIKYEINNNSNIYTKNYLSILKGNENIFIYRNVIDKKISDDIIQNYESSEWLKYTKNNELNICYYFCRTIPNKIYKSYCIQNITSFFTSEFLKNIKSIFNNREPNQVSILNCHKKKSIEYVIESSFIFEDEIAFLVIGNDLPISFFDLRNKTKINLLISSNTLLRINGNLRYELIFGIPKKKSIHLEDTIVDRKNSYLIIFRFIKENNIENILTERKNNENNKTEKQEKDCVSININDFDSENLEKKYVLDVYNKIAQHFDHTRYKTWKNVENIINEEKEGNMIIDIGCGSGKHLSVSSKYFFIGLDFSLYLLKIAQKKRNSDLFLANCVNIPLRSNLADLCISIAVIHHIGTHEKRKKAIDEMVRCTKIGGRILIYVWAYEQQDNIIGNRQFNSQDIFVPWYLQQQYTTKTSEEEKCNSYPFKKDLLKLHRYYHVFKKEEIYELCESINGVKIEKIYFDCNNWGIILRKVF